MIGSIVMNVVAAIVVVLLATGCGRIGIDPVTGRDGGLLVDEAVPTIDGSVDADPRAWWDPTWQRRIKLTFTNPGGALLGFPVMVRLSGSRIDYSQTLAAGQELRFVDDDGVTVLPHDIERWDEAGTSIVWVRVPKIDGASTTDHVWLYYANAAAVALPVSALVWGGYSLVWHLGENPAATAPQIRDSSAGGNQGTTVGGMSATQQNSGQAAGSLAFDGTDDWIAAPSSASLQLTGDLTLSMWVMRGMTARAEWLCDYSGSGESEPNNHVYELTFDADGDIELTWEYDAGLDSNTQSTVPVSTGIGAWMHITATRDVTINETRFYENGAPLGTPVSYTNDPTGGTTASLWVAGKLDSTSGKQPLAGRLDELRIEGGARSPAWIEAQYRSMTDGMIGYGAAESF